jgi:PleD family two-component response regulator
MTDYMMPEIDGFEMIAMIRNDVRLPSRGVPIICVSGHSERRIVEEAIRTGADDFIVKPIRAADIHSRILTHLNKPLARVETRSYFGPTRRRGLNRAYRGPERRLEVDFDAA